MKLYVDWGFMLLFSARCSKHAYTNSPGLHRSTESRASAEVHYIHNDGEYMWSVRDVLICYVDYSVRHWMGYAEN